LADLIGMGSLDDHEDFGAFHPQFWRTTAAT